MSNDFKWWLVIAPVSAVVAMSAGAVFGYSSYQSKVLSQVPHAPMNVR